MELKYIIKEKDIGKTVHTILTNELSISTRLLTKLIKNEKIFLNDIVCHTKNIVCLDDVIKVYLDMPEDNSNVIPTQMPLDIIYEDEWMLVINKPAGIPIHPSRAHFTDSLSNGIRFYFDTIHLHKKIRPINRLDLDTSGVVIFAKCEYIQEALIHQMCQQIFKKEYICLTTGHFENKIGKIDLPIARKTGSIIERCIDEKKGHPSITHYEVLKEFPYYSLVKCALETGRTHQIRVHMAAIGHPLLGDTLYGTSSPLISRQALHSYRIQCVHPIFQNKLIFESQVPEDIELLLK